MQQLFNVSLKKKMSQKNGKHLLTKNCMHNKCMGLYGNLAKSVLNQFKSRSKFAESYTILPTKLLHWRFPNVATTYQIHTSSTIRFVNGGGGQNDD